MKIYTTRILLQDELGVVLYNYFILFIYLFIFYIITWTKRSVHGFGIELKKMRTLVISLGKVRSPLDRLSITFTSNGKGEFVPRDQVSSSLVVYCSLFLHKLVVSCKLLSIRIVLTCFYLLIFHLEKFST